MLEYKKKQFSYTGSNILSTENGFSVRIDKTWTAINKLTFIWESDPIVKTEEKFL